MSSSYLLLKENKQDAISQNASNNQTVLHKDANTSSALSTLQTLEWSVSDVFILTLILFVVNVVMKLVEKLLDAIKKWVQTSKTKRQEDKNAQSALPESSKDHQ